MHSMGYDSPIVITRTIGVCSKSVDYQFTAGASGVHHSAHKSLCCGCKFDPITTSSDPSRDMGIDIPLCPGLCGPWADVTDGSGDIIGAFAPPTCTEQCSALLNPCKPVVIGRLEDSSHSPRFHMVVPGCCEGRSCNSCSLHTCSCDFEYERRFPVYRPTNHNDPVGDIRLHGTGRCCCIISPVLTQTIVPPTDATFDDARLLMGTAMTLDYFLFLQPRRSGLFRDARARRAPFGHYYR